MFTFFCTSCRAKLIVKNEALLGKIVPCPKCGSMVLVQASDDMPTPPVDTLNKTDVYKRFPDVLTHGTASGIIGQTSRANLLDEVFLGTDHNQTETDAPEIEVKTRRFLVAILFGLAILLLLVVGFLIVWDRPKPTEPETTIQVQPALPIAHDLLEDPTEDVEVVLPPIEDPPNVLTQEIPLESISIDDKQTFVEDDILSVIEERMSGLVDMSVPDIDIDAKLALPISELNFNQSRLIEFIRLISRMTEIPMTLDIDEMKPRSLSAQTPVSGRFRNTTAGEILTQTLATLDLHWITTDRQILISPKNTTEIVDLTFDVSDFAARTDDLTSDALAEMVQRLVCPDAMITVLPDNRLTIVPGKNSRKSQIRQRDEILRFLEQLRAIRQLPQKTEWTGETLAPEAFGWDRVMMPITLNYYRPVPLSRILSQLEEITDVMIIVDHQSLHRALCPFASIDATVQCDKGTINDVLELSLTSTDLVALAYRIVDHQTLEMTTAEAAKQAERMVMEVHRYVLQTDETPEDLVRSLRSAVAPNSWVVPEHTETQYGGDMMIDRVSNCLLVRQSQPVQRQIRLFLSTVALLEDTMRHDDNVFITVGKMPPFR